MTHSIKHKERVYLSDTDGWGMAWHGSYIKWLEKARTELMQKISFDIVNFNLNYIIEKEEIKFIKMGSLDQLLLINCYMEQISKENFLFQYEIFDENNKLMTTAISKFKKIKKDRLCEPQIKNNFYDFSVKTYLNDTDQTGKIWYGNYIKWFEASRIETTKSLGLDMNANGHDIVLPIISMNFENIKPIFIHEKITIRTYIEQLSKLKIVFAYEVINKTNEIVAKGNTVLVATNKAGVIYRRLPEIIIETYKKLHIPQKHNKT